MTEPVWHPLGEAAAFLEGPEGVIHTRQVGDRAVAVFRTGGALHAFADQCPHRGTPFSESGRILDGQLVCMVHYWAFTLPEGRQTHLPEVCLERFPLRIAGDQLEIGLPATDA